MHIEGLKNLHRDMRKHGVSRTQFKYKHNRVVFDVIFFTDSHPYQLLFGAVGHRCSFIVDVKQGYIIIPLINPKSAYTELCQALNLTYDPANPFSPKKFFNDFAAGIPASITVTKEPTTPPQQYAEINDDESKIYFSHWRNNGESSHVSAKNLAKTRQAFGDTIKTFCSSRNISSCWTTSEKK